MKTRENRFSIRKLSVGASSVVVATLLFMGGSSAQADRETTGSGNS